MDMKPDMPTDSSNPEDGGESISRMEPLLIAEGSIHRTGLTDLAVELAARSAGFRRSLPPGVHASLATLVRAMNCYYSNLIEGHATHPVDIERALKGDYSTEPEKRNLQIEATAHIAIRLSKAFGSTPETWLGMQMAYDLWQARERARQIKVESFAAV